MELPAFHGVPGWEFTPLDRLDLRAYPDGRAADPGSAPRLLQAPSSALSAGASQAEDRPRNDLAREHDSAGPIVLPLQEAGRLCGEVLERHLGSAVSAGEPSASGEGNPFVAYNDARWTDGWLVYVPAHLEVLEPIVLSTVHRPQTFLHHRVLIVLEEGAQAEVWAQQLSAAPEGEGISNGVVELFVGPHASLRFIEAQGLSERTWMFGAERAIVERDGHLQWTALGFGSANGKVFLETKLAEPGAHASITGAYATRGAQHLDFDTLQEHAAPNTSSDLAFRGVLTGRSSAVWRGMIEVDPGAQRTDAFQESRNLLLSKRAHADAIPGLEILADDVRCTHAAAVAQVDPEQLFYLASHGLPENAAKRLVIEGFLQAILERFAGGALREAIGDALQRRIDLVLAA